MFKKLIFVGLCIVNLNGSEYINFGKFADDSSLFLEKDITKLSEKFLGTKYVSNTLSNSEINTSKENLIINFDALDCFTFIDTFEALKSAGNKEEFKKNLIKMRYKDGDISYHKRNHFFSDWIEFNDMIDITCSLGKCEKKMKYLNDNEKYLKDIATVKREISYIKSTNIDITLLQDGDYIGIYTNKDALDVTHTGIIIKKEDGIFIRHASSLKKKIIDSELFDYTKNKLGILIYRKAS